MVDVLGARRKHGQQVIQAGAVLFLLSMLEGFLVRWLTLPRVGLSAHVVGVMQGLLLLTSGQLWPHLALGAKVSRATSVLLIAGCLSAWMGNVLAAAWGAGGGLLPQAAGSARGTAPQELVLTVLFRCGAVALMASWLLILRGVSWKSRPQSEGVYNASRQN